MPQRTKTDYIVVHAAATKPSLDIGRRQIREWHIAKGWADIGYSLVIRRNGLLEAGRHVDDVGAHVAGHNTTSVGICLVGGLYQTGAEAVDDFDGLYTKEQGSALLNALHFYKGLYPSATILGHRDLSPDKDMDGKIEQSEWLKTCPGFDVRAWCKRNGL
jgi:N-acetylmuramoyl-L-alanine amidase